MQYTITNNLVTLTVDEQACEMHSLKKNSSRHEYLWQGLPEFWKGRNPTLFPLVGMLPNKKYIFKGKEYEMGKHGFARNLPFKLINQDDASLTFELKDNEETLKQYPYHFNLQIKYTLVKDEHKVNIEYKIVNLDEEEMPFCFGVHPAFAITNLGETIILLPEEDDVLIEDSLFERIDTYILDPVKSQSATLVSGGRQLKVTFDGFPILAIWKPVKAPFVCIEPWYSSSLTISGITKECFDNWKYTMHLKPNETFNTSYSIEIIK